MESQRVCQRAHLRALLHLHPDWSLQQLADAVGCSKSTVSRWKKRFAEADPRDVAVLFSRSRAPHHHPSRIAEEVVERIMEIRLAPPENLKRTPGPKAVLYYLSRDETLRLGQWRTYLQEHDHSQGTIKKYTQAVAHGRVWGKLLGYLQQQVSL